MISYGNTVLLVEDESINQKLAAAVLKKIGFQVDLADNGMEAVNMARGQHYCLVLMDIQLPEMSGYEAARQIRSMEELEGGRRLPIIAMTADDSREIRRKCMAAGMDDFITKPIKPDLLMTQLAPWRGIIQNRQEQSDRTPERADSQESGGDLPAAVWDRKQTLAFVDGDLELFYGLAKMFIEKNQPLLETISRAIEENDGPALREAAHSYKGAVSHFSAEKMRSIAYELEIYGRGQNMGAAPPCFAELREMAEKLVSDLRKELAD
ncbi:response regulator [Desulfomarina sp.]